MKALNPFQLTQRRQRRRNNPFDPVLTYWFTIVPAMGLAGSGVAYVLQKYLFDSIDYTFLNPFNPRDFGGMEVLSQWSELSPTEQRDARKYALMRAGFRTGIGAAFQGAAELHAPGHRWFMAASAMNGALGYQTVSELMTALQPLKPTA